MIAVYRPMCGLGICVSADYASMTLYLRRPWHSGIRLGNQKTRFIALIGLDGFYIRAGRRQVGVGEHGRALAGRSAEEVNKCQ